MSWQTPDGVDNIANWDEQRKAGKTRWQRTWVDVKDFAALGATVGTIGLIGSLLAYPNPYTFGALALGALGALCWFVYSYFEWIKTVLKLIVPIIIAGAILIPTLPLWGPIALGILVAFAVIFLLGALAS